MEAGITPGGSNFEDFILNSLDSFQNINLGLFFKGILVALASIWFIVVIWVVIDSLNRYKKWYISIVWFVFVLIFNVLGLFVYLMIRPHLTLEERQWADLESDYIRFEMKSVVKCPGCRDLQFIENKFCSKCGTNLREICSNCNQPNSVSSRFCVSCGHELPVNAAQAPKPEPVVSKEGLSAQMESRAQVQTQTEVKAPVEAPKSTVESEDKTKAKKPSFAQAYVQSWKDLINKMKSPKKKEKQEAKSKKQVKEKIKTQKESVQADDKSKKKS